jgi:hypothetical protein
LKVTQKIDYGVCLKKTFFYYINEENPNEICFSVDNKYLAIACDRHVKVFYNLTGHRVAIVDFESKLKTVKTQAAKERIEQTIDEHKLVTGKPHTLTKCVSLVKNHIQTQNNTTTLLFISSVVKKCYIGRLLVTHS